MNNILESCFRENPQQLAKNFSATTSGLVLPSGSREWKKFSSCERKWKSFLLLFLSEQNFPFLTFLLLVSRFYERRIFMYKCKTSRSQLLCSLLLRNSTKPRKEFSFCVHPEFLDLETDYPVPGGSEVNGNLSARVALHCASASAARTSAFAVHNSTLVSISFVHF